MPSQSIERWLHDHTFGQDRKRAGERRTLMVIGITAATMVAEIVAGVLFGSMALLADGLHMGSHASALAISAFAYAYTRRRAKDTRFNFGTGKVNSLAAFASAVMLVIFALVMAGESAKRFLYPVTIEFNWAILVAVAGLVVNAVCLAILGGHGAARHDQGSEPSDTDHAPHGHGSGRHHDHNLWSAYLHVMADALTSLLAIFALLSGKYLGLTWLDPLMGVVGAILVVVWSWGLLRSSAHVLLDMQAPADVRRAMRQAIESEGDDRVADLHVWAVGPSIYAAELAVVTATPRDPEHYARRLPHDLHLVHVTVQVHRRVPDTPQEAEPR